MKDQSELLIVHIHALRIFATTDYLAIKECIELSSIFDPLPSDFLWRRDSGQTISQTEDIASYFQEVVDAIVLDGRAMALTLAFKVKELVAAAVRELNLGNLAAAAVLVRAALEASIASTNLLVKFRNAHKSLASKDPWDFLVAIDEQAEKLTIGAKWEFASRQPTNILTSLDAVAKHLGQNTEYGGSLPSIYSALSEISHPNSAGSNLYWKHDLTAPPVPSAPTYVEVKEKYEIAYDYHHLSMEAILWAVGFSSKCAVHSYLQIAELKFQARL